MAKKQLLPCVSVWGSLLPPPTLLDCERSNHLYHCSNSSITAVSIIITKFNSRFNPGSAAPLL